MREIIKRKHFAQNGECLAGLIIQRDQRQAGTSEERDSTLLAAASERSGRRRAGRPVGYQCLDMWGLALKRCCVCVCVCSCVSWTWYTRLSSPKWLHKPQRERRSQWSSQSDMHMKKLREILYIQTSQKNHSYVYTTHMSLTESWGTLGIFSSRTKKKVIFWCRISF